MKILFISPSYKPADVYGGPTVSVSELAEALAAAGHLVTIYTTTANGKKELEVETGVPVLLNGVTVFYFKRQTGDHTHVSIGLWKKLLKTATLFDVIHLQSWWSVLILMAAVICRKKGCKYIISPRGMLSGYSFGQQHSMPKKIIHKTIGLGLLRRSHLHATTLLEWNDCLRVNDSWRGFILPNLVRFPVTLNKKKLSEEKSGCLVFGYLSRIDPKKGIELFLQALSKVNFAYRFQIAGEGEEAYVMSLKQLISQLGIEANIEWCGWKKGEEKFDFLESVDVFVLTSYNENFANSVVESLVMGTPVLLSNEVGLADYVQQNKMGWICEMSVPSIVHSLQEILRDSNKLNIIHQLAPDVIRKDFDRTKLAQQYSKAYQQFS
ncbi:MAG: glycosyltransferase [Sphingobacteriales bacterium]|nr:MAG: glycosyltransferase [Sphingobacteriales bacterium]